MAKNPLGRVTEEPQELEDSLLPALKKLAVFNGIKADVLSKLLEGTSDRLVLSGDYIFRQDDPGSTLVVLINGLAVETKRIGRIDCLLNFYSSFSLLGESSFLESSNRSTSLYANEDCWISEIDNTFFRQLESVTPDQSEIFYANLGRELGKKVSNNHVKLNQASRYSFVRESFNSIYQY